MTFEALKGDLHDRVAKARAMSPKRLTDTDYDQAGDSAADPLTDEAPLTSSMALAVAAAIARGARDAALEIDCVREPRDEWEKAGPSRDAAYRRRREPSSRARRRLSTTSRSRRPGA